MRKMIVLVVIIMMVGVAFAGCTEESNKKKNKPPVASLSVSNMNPTQNEVITLDASNSTDPNKKDVAILEYDWDFGDDSKLNKSTGNKIIEHFYEKPGKYEITLLVFDRKTFDQATQTINVVNNPPTIDSYAPMGNVSVVELDTVTFEVNASDEPNKDHLTYQWSMDTEKLQDETSRDLIYTPPIDAVVGDHDISVRVSDIYGGFVYQTWTITIINKNRAPMIVSYSPLITDVAMSEMSEQAFTVTANDPDGDAVSYQWSINDIDVDGETHESFTYVPDYNGSGSYVVKVSISDGDLVTTRSWNLTVANTNRAPSIDSQTPAGNTATISETDHIDLSITASDADGDDLTYSWTLDSVPLDLEVMPDYSYVTGLDDAGDHEIVATVSDGKGGSDSTQWTITVDNLNQPPTIESATPSGSPSVLEMETLDFSVTASDPDGDSLTYQWYLNGTAVTGETTTAYTFSPDYYMGGITHTVGVLVNDPSNEEVWNNWTVTVINVNRAPAASATVNMTKPGVGLSVQFDASASTDPDGDVLSYIWNFGDNSAPQGGSAVQHSYAKPGIYNAIVRVSDGSLESTAQLVLDVNITETWNSGPMGQISNVVVADVDKDGTDEIVFGGLESWDGSTYTGFLYIYDGSNHNQEFKSGNIGRIYDLKVGNLDTDNALEIAIGTAESMVISSGSFINSGQARVYDGSTHSQEFNTGNVGYVYAVGIGDLDNDGTNELIAGHTDSIVPSGTTLQYYGNITVAEWDGSGWLVPWVSSNFNGMPTAIEVDDIDADNKDEAVIGTLDYLDTLTNIYYGRVVSVGHNGVNHVIENTNSNIGRVNTLTIADPDKDSSLEVVVGSYDRLLTDSYEGFIYVLSGTTLVQEWKSPAYGQVNALVVKDVDQDNINEIVFGTLYNTTEDTNNPSIYHPEGYLYILNGQNHNQKFKSTDIGGVMSLAVGNINDDNKLEIVVGTWTKKDASGNLEGYIHVFFYNSSQTKFEELWVSNNVGRIGSKSIVVADVDGDGAMDVVYGTREKWSSPYSGKFVILTNKNRP